jgi:hypothetical protein
LGSSDRWENRYYKKYVMQVNVLSTGITFDTMHKTNKHRMALTMFVGSNHQLLNVVFGQSLLRDESFDSIKWLFKTFKSCMGICEPHVLLTGKCWFSMHFSNDYLGSCNTL